MVPLLLLFVAGCTQTVRGEERLSEWVAGPVVRLEAVLHHVQGIDVERDVVWVSSVDGKAGKGYLSKFALPSGKLLAQVEVQEGRRIHPGGIMLDGDWVWVPVAEYHRGGPASIERRDKKTLRLGAAFTVNDHIGCVAVSEDELVGGSWNSRTLYRWTRDGRELGRVANPQATAYQDLKIVDGKLVASGVVSRSEGAVEWLDLRSYQLIRRVVAGKTDRGVPYMQEGMALREGKLYLLPEDDPSRLFVFTEKARR